MEYLITCSCGKEVAVSKSQAGQEVPCECGNSVQVPTLRGFSALKTVEPLASGRPKRSSNVWRGWRGPTMAVCALLFLAASLYSVYHVFDSYRYDTQYTAEDLIEEQNANLDLYGPDELTILWTNYQHVGLRQRHPPTFHVMNEFSKEQAFVSQVSGIVAGVFAAAMVGIWLSTLGKKDCGKRQRF